MNRLLNLISILFGAILIVCGVLKLFGMFSSFKILWGDIYFTMPNSTNLFFIIVVNFIGGFAMLYHASMTINIRHELPIHNSDTDLIDSNQEAVKKEISKLVMRAGSITLIISLWFFIRMITVVGGSFSGEIMNHLELFIFVVILYGSFAILPIILVSKNISHNMRIMKKNEREKIAAFHARKRSMSQKTRK